MKCPVCQEKKLTSYVYPGAMVSTLLGFTPFYDEKGDYHIHNPNRTTVTYTCSNGHKWKVQQKSECPSCSYGDEPEKIFIDEQKETK